MIGAGNEIRTRDPNLGKVVLYQLSYSRLEERGILPICVGVSTKKDGVRVGIPRPTKTVL